MVASSIVDAGDGGCRRMVVVVNERWWRSSRRGGSVVDAGGGGCRRSVVVVVAAVAVDAWCGRHAVVVVMVDGQW